jgi:hypothetical protein
MDEDNKKITIEVVRDSEDWLDFPPRISVKEEGDKEPTIYGKSSRSTFDVAVLEPKVFEVVNRYPKDEDAFTTPYNRICGEGDISSIKQSSVTPSGFTKKGDTIGFIGSNKRHNKVHVEIRCDVYEPTDEEKQEEIEEKGKVYSDSDYVEVQGFPANYDEAEKFYVVIVLRNEDKFNELFRRVRDGEITSLGIVITTIEKLPGIYRRHMNDDYEFDYNWGQEFFYLDSDKSISNITQDELKEIRNNLHFDSYWWQLSGKYSDADFNIQIDPIWVTPEIFSEEDEEEFDDIEEEIEEETENPFVPKVPSSDEHIAEQTVVLNRIFKVLTVIAFIMVLLIFAG